MHVISPAAQRLFVTSVIARLPLAMLGVGLMVHIQRLTGSFAAAGAVTAAYGTAIGVGGPVLGRLVDRHGQTIALLATTCVSGVLLTAIALVPAHISLVVPVLLAAGVGLATPPVGACLRSQLPSLLSDPDTAGAAYAFETTIVELTWVAGPPLVLALGVLWSTGWALVAAAAVLVIFTTAFAAQPSSRSWKPALSQRREAAGALRAPAMRRLTVALLGVGVLLGADEIAVTAAARGSHGTTASAAPLLALWGAGSFLGGLIVTRITRSRPTTTSVTRWLVALAIAHLALIPAAGNATALAIMLPLAGATIAPTEAAVYQMVEAAAPANTITEAFSWLLTAMEVGAALGAATAGILIDRYGPGAGLAFGGGACALTTLIAASPRSAPRRAAGGAGGGGRSRPRRRVAIARPRRR
jgi:predicted MFS family arabinose efflux permease